MGVQGLWDLLAPVGRRVSVETLAGRKLAIDASIWIIQFMKAMRDEKGEMVRNGHILGFFRRICKLLYLRTKPVFVFDGGTPSLKRRTVIARRRQRENAQAKIRKTAEKLLLNHLKAMKLKELATDLGNQRKQNDPKGKKVITEPTETMQNTAERNGLAMENHDKEALDEMLAASIQAEEGGNFADDASASCGWAPAGNDDTDEDEEMILPAMHGKVDPSVLAALPPSMQLDLLGQMRERLMAENRQKYQKVKKAPEKFSELQIQAYLKTVAFRREIDEVRKSAAGRGIGGVRTSRIASEANREFIFSSSFTGDKDVLASAGEDQARKRASEVQPENNAANATGDAGTRKSSSVLESIVTEPREAFDDDVETYMDERGHLRVSRLRAMGIRMTRDLQRNLDMMKEIEEESIMSRTNDSTDMPTVSDTDTIHPNSSIPADDGTACLNNKSEEPELRSGTSIEISFEDNFERTCANDDDVFARLVAGDPAVGFSINRSPTEAHSPGSDSDVEWEEGVIEEKDDMLSNSSRRLDRAPLEKDDTDSETEVEWEEGCLGICKESSLLPSDSRSASKGAMEEEADFQEAVKRSLEDLRDQISIDKSLKNEMSEEAIHMVTQGLRTESVDKEHDCPEALDSCLLAQIGEQFEANSRCEKLEIVKEIGQTVENLHGCVHSDRTISLNGSEINTIKKKIADSTGEVSIHKGGASDVNKLPNTRSSDTQQYELGAASRSYIHETTANAFPEGFISDISSAQKLYEEGASDGPLMEGKDLSNVWGSAESIEDQKVARASLEEEMHELDKERDRLGDEQRKLERNAESVSSEMFTECQELLQMFGLPYIIAPMEAEAQCAYMELTNLVDGVVTDDSDAFLFGARSVYKNIFDDRKYVETYLMKDMENELGLDREKLIRMALLLGSDYTEGVSGIGIVNAIEVVNAFPEKDGLQKFREWVESPDPSILGGLDTQAGSSSSKRGCKVGDTNNFLESEGVEKLKQVFMNKHRNISKNWHIPSSFPSTAVISAYDSPQVDKSTEPFAWGKPDVSSLRKVCWEKFGWSSQKSDELLIPVLKEYNKHETQLRMEAFYMFNERFAKIRSKRIKKAVKHMTGSKSKDMDVENIEDPSNEEIKMKRKSVGKQSRKRKGEQLQTEQLEPPEGASGGGKNTSKRSAGSRKGGPREKTQSAGKASKKSHSGFLKTSSEEERDSDIEQPSQIEELEKPNQTRRSERRRKAVNYTETKDDDTDKADPRNGDTTTEKLERSKSQAADMGPTSEHHPTDSCKMNEIDVSNYLGPQRLSDFRTSADVDTGGAEMEYTVQPSISDTDDPPAEDILSKEYLKMGGGFCLEEEDGDDMEQEINASSPSREIGENETELDIDIVTDNASHKASEIQEITENNDNMSGSVFLRAMPNLRKRKKSS